MPSHLHTEIEIHATPERVWNILTDFAAYPEWNPFIPRIEGSATVGSRLDVRLQPPGGRAMSFRPRVVAVEPAHELRWLGHLAVPGLFDGEHGFRIEAMGPDRVRFTQEERFSGFLVPVLLRMVRAGTIKGFEAMNQALKARAESPPSTSSSTSSRNSCDKTGYDQMSVNTTPVPAPVSRFSRRLAFGLLTIILIGALVAALIAPGSGGWQALGFALAPDIALFAGIAPGLAPGQLHPRAVPLYNALHHWAGPVALGVAAVLWLGVPWLAGALAWASHIAIDRTVGYGPRTPEGWQRD